MRSSEKINNTYIKLCNLKVTKFTKNLHNKHLLYDSKVNTSKN